jgi:hypothetical protein
MEKLDRIIDDIRNDIVRITDEYIGVKLTEELIEKIEERLGVDKVTFYDNHGNSNNDCDSFHFLKNKTIKIVCNGYIIEEYHNLVYYSTLREIYVGIPCRIVEQGKIEPEEF